ncbi:MAG: HupE/UreJ family protein [Phycisphaerales bacterium]|nr:MAG: HupE/UreJ family protein [Phycisphaerales bacterium]
MSTELGPFYDGAVHPLVTPEDLMTILGLSVLAAFGGARAGRTLLLSLSLAWCVGAFTAYSIAEVDCQVPLLTAALLLLLGVTGLFKASPPTWLLGAAGGVIGLIRGAMNGGSARAQDGEWLCVVGIVTSVFVLAALLAGLTVVLEQRRVTIVLRVAASWIAASGLLMLGWELRGLATAT